MMSSRGYRGEEGEEEDRGGNGRTLGGGKGAKGTPSGTSRTEIYLARGIILETQLYFTATRLRLPSRLSQPQRNEDERAPFRR